MKNKKNNIKNLSNKDYESINILLNDMGITKYKLFQAQKIFYCNAIKAEEILKKIKIKNK